jgi:predicted permease
MRSEVEFYLEERIRELEESGMSPGDAAEEARRRFGDVDEIVNEMLEAWEPEHRGWRIREMMGSFAQDLRFAGRMLVRNPGFALVALATLALGIGANTAIFSVADATFLERPAVLEPTRLVNVYTTCRRGQPRCSSSYPDYVDYRDRSSLLAGLAVETPNQAVISRGSEGGQLATYAAVTGNYFNLLGVIPDQGRILQTADDVLEAPAQVVVLSHGIWVNQFGADPDIIGTTVRINTVPFEVVGVAGPDFRGTRLSYTPEFWMPLAAVPILTADGGNVRANREAGADGGAGGPPEIFRSRTSRWMGGLVGRLAPGATVEQLKDEMASISLQLAEEYPDERGPRTITVESAGTYSLPVGAEDQMRSFVRVLLGVVAFSLLLATANLANLLLTRATARQKEMGIRTAIGAGRGRVIRQLLVESTALSIAGGALGIGVAALLIAGLSSYDLPGGVTVGSLGVDLNGRVLAFTVLLSTVTGLVFGLYPALQASRTSVVDALKGETSHRTSGAGRARSTLIAVQVGLCLILLAGAGTFIATLRSALDADLGFDTAGVAAARFNLRLQRYTPEQARQFVQDLESRVEALPGVVEAAVASRVPLQPGGYLGILVEVDGYERAEDEEIRVETAFTTPGYLQAIGASLLDGRSIGSGDLEDAPPVFAVNRTFAERYWPDGQATGGGINYFGIPVEVVGVFDNISWLGVDGDPYPVALASLDQRSELYLRNLTIVARTTGDASALASQLRDEIKALDPEVEPSFASPMEDLLASVLMTQRLGTLLLSALAALALVLAAVGIAGVVSYTVSQRVREVGIRIALGATGRQVSTLVAGGVALPVGLGVLLGTFAALALGQVMSAFVLFDVNPADPVRVVAVGLIMLTVGMTAAVLPARRAAGVDPMRALRTE